MISWLKVAHSHIIQQDKENDSRFLRYGYHPQCPFCRRPFKDTGWGDPSIHSLWHLAQAEATFTQTGTFDAEDLATVCMVDCTRARELLVAYVDRGGDLNKRFGTPDADSGGALESAIYWANASTFDLLLERGVNFASHLDAYVQERTCMNKPHALDMLVPVPPIVSRLEQHAHITRRVLTLIRARGTTDGRGGAALLTVQQLHELLYMSCRAGATPLVEALLEEGFRPVGLPLPRKAVYAVLRYHHREMLALLCRDEWGGARFLGLPRGRKLRSRSFDPDYDQPGQLTDETGLIRFSN